MQDVLVVGAGPAGSAVSALLAEGGVDVVCLDRATFPRPKVCAEYVSPEADRVLDRTGVLDTVLRERFDGHLARAAVTRGADLREGATVDSIERERDGEMHVTGGAYVGLAHEGMT